MWLWIAIGVGSFFGLSAIVGFVAARILGTIAREISELQEADDWAMLPPSQAAQATADEVPEDADRLVRASPR